MLFGLFWGDFTLLILIPGVLFSAYAGAKVHSTVRTYAAVPLRPGMTGANIARRILDSNGLNDVMIEMVGGSLTDHYDPRTRVLRLSQDSYYGNSVSSVCIAAHEAGHAIQHGRNYFPLHLRSAFVPLANLGSNMAMPLFLIGLLLSGFGKLGDGFMFAGIAAFSLAVIFQLITLPVEVNASHRAMRCLRGSGVFSEEELKGSRKVLTAAAMTYVASLFMGLLSLLRLLLIAFHSRGNDR